MNRQEICERLCSYDPRNPISKDLLESLESIGAEPAAPGAETCSCDNCFYGRHRLAEALLSEMDRVPPLFQWVLDGFCRDVEIQHHDRDGWVSVAFADGERGTGVRVDMDTKKPQRFEEAAVKEAEATIAASLAAH